MPAKLHGKTVPTTNGHSPALRLPARELMKDQAYAAIKRFILDGDLAPGAFLAERRLAGQLRMSKTPVRAALQRLEAEGFVTISPQQGILIRDLSVLEIADQYGLRAALETYVLRTVAGKLSADQVARLRDNLADQAALAKAPDVGRGAALDAEFHLMFAEVLGNAEVLRVMRQLWERFHRITAKVFRVHPGRVAASYEEHRAIADAVIRGDGALAARLGERHLECGKQILLSPWHG
jgi:DNA-binding GntR family transcriptional regulator